MPAYATVSWSPDDDITSQKLQQMSDNDEYLKAAVTNCPQGFSSVSWPSYFNNQSTNQIYMQAGFSRVITDGAGAGHIVYPNPFPNGTLTVVATMSSDYAQGGYCNIIDLPTAIEGNAGLPDVNGFWAMFYSFPGLIDAGGTLMRWLNANVTVNWIAIGY